MGAARVRLTTVVLAGALMVLLAHGAAAQTTQLRSANPQTFTSRLGSGSVQWSCSGGHFEGAITFTYLPTTELPIPEVQSAHYAFLLAAPGKDAGSFWLPLQRGATSNGGYQSFATQAAWISTGDRVPWDFTDAGGRGFKSCAVPVSFYLMDAFHDADTIDYGDGHMGPAVDQAKAIEIPLQWAPPGPLPN